ncbi:MAG: outer membrane beta-barrel domain-containing protein [Deltaproteobacteria bacterium]|nr:outer membrane beta-barrel domain-containing protein [Deltaproteobacteria bacterium]
MGSSAQRIPGMPRAASGLALLCCLALAAPAAAQGSEKAEPSSEKKAEKKAEKTDKAETDKTKEKVEVRKDRIKSIQRKVFLKSGRWEMAPVFALSLNDAFYQKMGGGASVVYHPADSLGIDLHGVYVGTIQTDMVVYFQQANGALPKVSRLRYFLTANLQWSPLYGKLSFITDDILHFDAYLLAGFGMAYTETGAKFAADFGLGLRYFLTSWLVVKIEVRDLVYTETFQLDVSRTEFSDIQNHVMLNLGLSFFLPTGFDYEYQ